MSQLRSPAWAAELGMLRSRSSRAHSRQPQLSRHLRGSVVAAASLGSPKGPSGGDEARDSAVGDSLLRESGRPQGLEWTADVFPNVDAAAMLRRDPRLPSLNRESAEAGLSALAKIFPAPQFDVKKMAVSAPALMRQDPSITRDIFARLKGHFKNQNVDQMVQGRPVLLLGSTSSFLDEWEKRKPAPKKKKKKPVDPAAAAGGAAGANESEEVEAASEASVAVNSAIAEIIASGRAPPRGFGKPISDKQIAEIRAKAAAEAAAEAEEDEDDSDDDLDEEEAEPPRRGVAAAKVAPAAAKAAPAKTTATAAAAPAKGAATPAEAVRGAATGRQAPAAPAPAALSDTVYIDDDWRGSDDEGEDDWEEEPVPSPAVVAKGKGKGPAPAAAKEEEPEVVDEAWGSDGDDDADVFEAQLAEAIARAEAETAKRKAMGGSKGGKGEDEDKLRNAAAIEIESRWVKEHEARKKWLKKRSSVGKVKGSMSDRRRQRMVVNQPWLKAPWARPNAAPKVPTPLMAVEEAPGLRAAPREAGSGGATAAPARGQQQLRAGGAEGAGAGAGAGGAAASAKPPAPVSASRAAAAAPPPVVAPAAAAATKTTTTAAAGGSSAGSGGATATTTKNDGGAAATRMQQKKEELQQRKREKKEQRTTVVG